MTALAAAILAGGRATRMGGQAKSFLVVDGARVIDRQLAVLRTLTPHILVVANDVAAYADLGVPVVPDEPEAAGQGPLAGILAALVHAPAAAERVLVVACDMPHLAAAPLARLVAAADPAVDIAAPPGEPLCAVYAATCIPVIRARLAAGHRKASDLLADPALRVAIVSFTGDDLRVLTNVNSPDDLRRAGYDGRAMLRPAPLVAVLAVAFLCACGGSGKPAPAAPKAAADPPGLVKLRTAYAAFAASPMAATDFDTLATAHDAEREQLEPAGRAEADLIVAFAGVTILEKHLEPLAEPDDAGHDLLAATVLPLVWQARPLDGESAPAFRDRLCQGPGATACANVLPDFWGAALAYEAAKQLDARAKTLSEACACAARYGSELTRAKALAEAAMQHDADQRPGWGLDMDNLARSAFATPELPPGDVRVKVRAAELLPGKRKAIAAKLSERRAAAAAAPEGGAHVLEVEALADGKPADLTLLAQAARDAGFAAVLLVVRVAAPPNPRGFLRVELAAPRAPKGTTALALAGKIANMQAVVDKIDAAFGTSDHARVVWVVK